MKVDIVNNDADAFVCGEKDESNANVGKEYNAISPPIV